MGLSSSKSSTSTKPVYGQQLTDTYNNLNQVSGQVMPGLISTGNQMGSLIPGLSQDFKNGNPNVNQASGFNSDVLSGKYLNSNPYFDTVMGHVNDDVRNQSQASLGTHGLYGDSSAMADIVSRNIGNTDSTMRMNNYNTGLNMMGQQAALAPSLAAAKYLPIEAMGTIADAQSAPLRAAVGQASAVGGLLGQYTNSTTKSSQSIMSLLAQAAGNAASAYAAGG